MAPNQVLIALTCAVAFPVAALAQSPAWTMAAKADCCATATDDGVALAASVLLPPAFTLPVDEGATALATSVLLPAPSAGCCDAGPGAAVDHTAHSSMPAAKQADGTGQAVAGMACCTHGAKAETAKPDAACCQDMKEECGMPCCQSMPPVR